MKKIVSIFMMAIMLITMCSVNSTDAHAAAKVELNKEMSTVRVGCSTKLKLKNATSIVTWSSADESIAKVNANGKVTGIRKGVTEIRATHKKKNYKCVVTVKSSKINCKKTTLSLGQTIQLRVLKRFPKENETEKDVQVESKVKWTSSDKKIVKVNKNGFVTTKGEGSANITAKVRGEKYTCNITVVKELNYDDFSYASNSDIAETYYRYYSRHRWGNPEDVSDRAMETSHFREMLASRDDFQDYYFRCYVEPIDTEENRGIVIGNTAEDVKEKFGQTGWYSCKSENSCKQKAGITSQMTYCYKQVTSSDITYFEKTFYFDENDTLILIEWRLNYGG